MPSGPERNDMSNINTTDHDVMSEKQATELLIEAAKVIENAVKD